MTLLIQLKALSILVLN